MKGYYSKVLKTNHASKWRNKGPILVTGHTGFKGTWLTLLLKELGLDVVGYSLSPKEESIYNFLGLKGAIPEVFEDIRNEVQLSRFIGIYQPSAVIHLDAQPIVLESYKNPSETFDVNVMGAINLMTSLEKSKTIEAAVIATTDKVYKNNNSGQRFIEDDPLEGTDPYSSSKVAVEAVVKSWQNLYARSGRIRLIAARAGNVIGGGDLSANRLIPDCIWSHLSGTPVILRNPESVRPWQHVLDPIYGYLQALSFGILPAYNFGPNEQRDLTVREVIEILKEQIEFTFKVVESEDDNYESKILSLNSELARETLNWSSVYNQRIAIFKTAEWWKNALSNGDSLEFTKDQIREYIKLQI